MSAKWLLYAPLKNTSNFYICAMQKRFEFRYLAHNILFCWHHDMCRARLYKIYRKTSSISRTLAGNKTVDNSDVVGASPVGAAPTTSSFST